MKKIRHIINVLIWTIVGLYLAIVAMVNIPLVQNAIGSTLAKSLEHKFGTEVHIGRVSIGFFNRIIIDDVSMLDQKGKNLLRSARLSAKISYSDLAQGKLTITSAQIFGLDANLYRATAETAPNFQFVIDSLKSKDNTNNSKLSVAINSLVIRRGKVEWNQLDAIRRKTFDLHHISVSNISSHMIIGMIGGDSINVKLKNLSFNESSGIKLKSLSFKLTSNKENADVQDFALALSNSEINIPYVKAKFKMGYQSKYTYKGEVAQSYIVLSDLYPFVPKLNGINRKVFVKSKILGSDKRIEIKRLVASMPSIRKGKVVNDIHLEGNGYVNFGLDNLLWQVNIKQLSTNISALKTLAVQSPDWLKRFNSLQFEGRIGGYGSNIDLKGSLLSDAGNADIKFSKIKEYVRGHLSTKSFNIAQLLNDKKLGIVSADIGAKGNIKEKRFDAKGLVHRMDYNSYSYKDINLGGSYNKGALTGKVQIDDPNLRATFGGILDIVSKTHRAKLYAYIENLSPSKLHIFEGRLSEAEYSGKVEADILGNDLNTIKGILSLRNFVMHRSSTGYFLDSLTLRAGSSRQGHFISLHGDFGNAVAYGKFAYSSLPQVFTNFIVKKLPSITKLTSLRFKPVDGDVSIKAKLSRTDWAQALFDVPLDIKDTLTLSAQIDGIGNNVNADLNAPDLNIKDRHIKNLKASVYTIAEKMNVDLSLTNMRGTVLGTDMNLSAEAANDNLHATLAVDNHAGKDRLRGSVSTFISLYKGENNKTFAELNIEESNFRVGDTLFTVHPSKITYTKNNLMVDQFAITSGTQSLIVKGTASNNKQDSLTAIMHNIDVSYILDLVNFHSVEFNGALSGTAYISNLFNKPRVNSRLRVENFQLIKGNLGTLYATADWNSDANQIDIDAVAHDTINGNQISPRNTFIKGYVSIPRNYIDLSMTLQESRAEFLGNLCSSFLSDVDFSGSGNLRLWGDLKKINLTGDVVGHGSASVSPLGVRYSIPHALVHFKENEIVFDNDSIFDSYGNLGIITGALHHRHLGHMTYDLDVQARKLLAYNFDGSDGSSFYGKVFGTGDASISGQSGEVSINVNVKPERNSEIVYDISTPEGVGSQNFIHWRSRDSLKTASLMDTVNNSSLSQEKTLNVNDQTVDIPTDIRINLSIDANPDATLRLITDKASGDYITLNGSGNLRSTYFNKGSINIFGTYTIDHGVYKLTIQNIIKRVFEFTQGGTIVFEGDPYSALLNLKAQYPIASVSLSDLQVGRSFSANNIRVNCLMDITGTPSSPKVDFNLDFPTLSQDQQQMISSVINGEEEMNQQVLYLLAVGRFYSRGTNNSEYQVGNQTSLAMQSILSGQLSQQINNVLSSMMKTNLWNFGANISTGDEGWNNAVYEGMLSGRLLNNRLLINGQFGYRDNANASQSFIGDFDVRYLIFPNDNFSVHVYNKANDRYFIRNSLNTQGIGFILKKDFSSLRDLLGLGKKKVNANPSK